MKKISKNKIAKAIALQVKECGCFRCKVLVRRALGTEEGIQDFWKNYSWDGN